MANVAQLIYDINENAESLLTSEDFFNLCFEGIPKWAICFSGLRHREDLTQVEFAKKLGINQSFVSAIETGRKPIGKKLAHKIANTFKTDYRLFL